LTISRRSCVAESVRQSITWRKFCQVNLTG
jgi:hypothetical protein